MRSRRSCEAPPLNPFFQTAAASGIPGRRFFVSEKDARDTGSGATFQLDCGSSDVPCGVEAHGKDRRGFPCATSSGVASVFRRIVTPASSASLCPGLEPAARILCHTVRDCRVPNPFSLKAEQQTSKRSGRIRTRCIG